MAVEIGPEWDPGAHDYEATLTPGATLYVTGVMGLVGMGAFSLLGIGAFFTYEAAVASPAAVTTVTYVIGSGANATTVIYAAAEGGVVLTESQATFVAMVEAGGMASEPVSVTAILASWGFQATWTEGELLILAAYEPPTPLDRTNYGNFGAYLGYFQYGLPGGGLTTPPGFPGFPGVGYPFEPGEPHGFFCVKYDDVDYCHWQY